MLKTYYVRRSIVEPLHGRRTLKVVTILIVASRIGQIQLLSLFFKVRVIVLEFVWPTMIPFAGPTVSRTPTSAFL